MGFRGEILVGLGAVAAVFTAAALLCAPPISDSGLPPSLLDPPLSPSASPSGPAPLATLSHTDIRLLQADGQVVTLPLEEYVQGVVTAEMPAAFQPAALEAQAVAARTYALRRRSEGRHAPDADLCADPACCQAYTDHAPENWGADAPAYQAKLHAAVAATAGEVLTWEGEPIQAVFHSSSYEYTAPALAVWGQAVPYLVSVTSPETAQDVPNFETEVTFTPDQFRALASSLSPAPDLAPSPTLWFSDLIRTTWGGVKQVDLGGVTVSGNDLRTLCGLRSTRFDIEAGENTVTFRVTAYGHAVGMSQYGANTLAKSGSGYRDILAHYYPGVTLETI